MAAPFWMKPLCSTSKQTAVGKAPTIDIASRDWRSGRHFACTTRQILRVEILTFTMSWCCCGRTITIRDCKFLTKGPVPMCPPIAIKLDELRSRCAEFIRYIYRRIDDLESTECQRTANQGVTMSARAIQRGLRPRRPTRLGVSFGLFRE